MSVSSVLNNNIILQNYPSQFIPAVPLTLVSGANQTYDVEVEQGKYLLILDNTITFNDATTQIQNVNVSINNGTLGTTWGNSIAYNVLGLQAYPIRNVEAVFLEVQYQSNITISVQGNFTGSTTAPVYSAGHTFYKLTNY
jgi:hypothetical protein